MRENEIEKNPFPTQPGKGPGIGKGDQDVTTTGQCSVFESSSGMVASEPWLKLIETNSPTGYQKVVYHTLNAHCSLVITLNLRIFAYGLSLAIFYLKQ